MKKKFQTRVDSLDVKTRTSKVLRKTFLDINVIRLRFMIEAKLDYHGRCLTSYSFPPVKEMGF